MAEYRNNRRDRRSQDRDRESHGPSNVRIIVNENESIEKVIRKFKKLCEKAGIKKEIKARRYYEKPSEARRREERKSARDRYKNEKGKKD